MRRWVLVIALVLFSLSLVFPTARAYAWDSPTPPTPVQPPVAGEAGSMSILPMDGLGAGQLVFSNWERYTWDWPSAPITQLFSHPFATTGQTVLSGVISLLQDLHGLLAVLSSWLVLQALHLNIVNQVAAQLASLVEGVKEGLLGKLLTLALLAPVAWFVWQGLVHRRATKLWGGAVATILIFGVGLWFLGNAGMVVTKAGEVGDAIATEAAAATTAPLRHGTQMTAEQAMGQTLETLWAVTYRIPWAYGTYGQNDSTLVGTGKPTTVSRDEAEAMHNPSLEGMNWTDLLVNSAGKTRQDMADVLADPKLDHGDHPQSKFAMQGVAYRLSLTLLFLVPTILSIVLNGMLAGFSVLAQLMILLLVLAAPAVILVGMIPETGWRIVRSWATALIGAFLVKGVYGLLIGLTLLASAAVYRVADTVGMAPTVLAAVMSIFFAGAVMLHGKLRHFALASASEVHQKIVDHGAEGIRDMKQSAQRQVARVAGTFAAGGTAAEAGKTLLGRRRDTPVSQSQKLHKAAHDVLSHQLAHDELLEAQGQQPSNLLHEVRAREEHGIEKFSNEQLAATMEQVKGYARREHVSVEQAARIITHQDSSRFADQATRQGRKQGSAGSYREDPGERPAASSPGDAAAPGTREARTDGAAGPEGEPIEEARASDREGTGAEYAERRREELGAAIAAARAAHQEQAAQRAEEHKADFDVRRNPLKSAARASAKATKGTGRGLFGKRR